MRYWMRFWLFVGAVLAALTSLGVVVYNSFWASRASVSPILDTNGLAITTAVLFVSIGIIVWRATDENGFF